MAIFCVLYLQCGDSGVCYTLVSCAVGGGGSCGTAMLKMDNICFSAAVCFSPIFGMRMGSGGILWGHLPCMVPHLLGEVWGVYSALGIVLLC